MLITGYTDKTGQKQHLYTSLIQECQLSSPGSRLSNTLRRKIESFCKEDRQDVVSKTVDGCAPLFLACKNGSAEVVEYLLTRCSAPVEQKGLFEVRDEGVNHSVTPLWCAAVSGRSSVVRILLKYGADVNALSDTGSTPVRSACYIVRPGLSSSHMEIIRALVEHGADIQLPNHFGGTCLINSVQSPELVKYLLDHGADVNADDVQRKTALHYAVQEHRLETVKILLEYGADPYISSKYGDDALQTACIKGAIMVFNYLIDKIDYPIAKVCDAFELLGSSFLLDLHDMGTTLFLWRKALEIRNNGEVPVPKPYTGIHHVLGIHEFSNRGELDILSSDLNQLKVQALLITERILGSHHKDTIFRYMYAGAGYADSSQFNSCIGLWNYALQLKIEKETVLSSDASFTIRAVIQLFMNIYLKEANESSKDLHFKDVANTTRCLNTGLKAAQSLVHVIPQFKSQLENWDLVLNSWLHLVFLLLKLVQNDDDRRELFNIVKNAKNTGIISSNGDTLLHLAVSSTSAVRQNNYIEDENYYLFPNYDVIKFLLFAGFNVHARKIIILQQLSCCWITEPTLMSLIVWVSCL
ncbi:protein fem-1 homolog C isoform X2 [Eurytemora carolleeae]|uniref:protein fem-1 homolog C isoform X2 n=1 Tax=Eurytemora carolleeae TaxID=1294199 RepID=UPI000C75B2E8|nr:protein fem-1 homolog C isoform X2 [Eurytemora carolleeae]|eukprot:XP_023322386.1 protein fem-1 homolog C-like isoform X2 [Eurytemora affinis]